MKEYFRYIESSNRGFTICPKWELFGEHTITGSWALLPCRFMGITWPDWLRLCQQSGAKLYGKGHLYVNPIWETPNNDLIKLLNSRINEIAAHIDITELNY